MTTPWDGEHRRAGECSADQALVCPWKDEEQRAQVEAEIAQRAGRQWWSGFPWAPFGLVLGLALSLGAYIWTGMSNRVQALDATVRTHEVGNATTGAELRQLKVQIVEMRSDVSMLHGALNARNDKADETNAMLKRLLKER